MTDYIDVSFIGDKKLERKLKRMALATQRKIVRAGINKAMKQVKDRAKELVPVDTGKLRDSIKQKRRTRRGISRAMVVTGTREELGIGANERGFYPAVLEYGTRDRTARPYLRAALAEKSGQVIDDAAAHIKQGIEDVAKK